MKQLVLAATLGISLFCNGQQTEKKFHFGIGIVGGTLTNTFKSQITFSPTLSAGITALGEYRFSSFASGFSSVNYNVVFHQEGPAATFVSALAGPRIYSASRFFFGLGVGYGKIITSGYSSSGFSYEPQLGMDIKNSQLVLGYNTISLPSSFSVANLNIKAIIKL
jgi:hypothetical protein